ncbi:MAG: PKD domain-containing protein, partial [Candidatus Omnitrophota bacterium]
MKNIARPNIAGVFRVRCLSILLIAALCLANIQPAFAGFDSIASSGFSASVTIGEVKNAYPEKPDLYALAYPYIKYYLDRALDTTIQTDYSFNGFTRSFQRYNGGGTANCESLIFSGAAGYDQAILGRICLFNGITTILDTYVSFYNNISDAANPILKCSDGYTDGDGNALLYGPYRIARITNRGTSSDWWSNWDWSVDTGAAAVLIMYAAEAYDKTSTQDYRKFAALLGGYMLKLQDTDGGLRYGPRGMYHDSGPDFYWNLKSTEHNERALYAFEALFRMTQDSAYQQAADRIKTWLKGMYDFDAHLFHSSSSYENNVWVRSNFSYVATDVTALAPLSMIFDDTFFGATQGQRDAEVDAMFAAIETRTAFLDINDKPVFFKFSVSQTGSYGSVEISSQMALAYLRAAQIHHERGSSEIKAAQYLDKYNTLVNSLGGFFSVPGDDSASMIAPYASYLDKAVAGNVPTGTGFDTYNCEAALASGYFVFAKAGYIPYLYNGGNGIPDVGAVVMPPSGDSDYDGIPDDHDADPYDPYDAYEMDDDGFTGLEKYALSARGIDIFDSTMYVAFSASPSAGQIPLDVTFTVNAAGSDIVKYEWDFDGNGTYDRWQYASEGNTVRYKYTAAGAHNVRVRVTNKSGKIAVSSLTVNALKAPSAPSAQLSGDLLSYPVVNEFVIASTRALKGAGTASSGKEVVMYQWDVSGTGEYELSSAKSADATRRFDETISRMFTGALKVTDSQGLSDIAYLSVMSNATGWDNSNYRPVVYLDNNVVYGTASSSVALGGYGIPAAGNSYGYAKKLEWDFESDGIYDWSSSVENNAWTGFAGVTHKYGAPGVYRATLKAHTEANLSSYKTGVVIVEGGEPAIRAEALVSPDGGSFTGEIASGVIPVKARFSHLSSTADAVKFEWDFDGDKRI